MAAGAVGGFESDVLGTGKRDDGMMSDCKFRCFDFGAMPPNEGELPEIELGLVGSCPESDVVLWRDYALEKTLLSVVPMAEIQRLREQVTELQEDSNKKLEIIRELRNAQLSRQVAEFRKMAGFKRAQDVPHVPTKEGVVQCLLPVVEEFFELLEACGCYPVECDIGQETWAGAVQALDIGRFNLPEFADAMADLDYTVEGIRQLVGIDGAPIAKAVHRSNMEKRGGKVDENGKLRKPDSWKPPAIAEELKGQGWAP